LRSIEEIEYLEEPDMFHDVFAHVPMLSDERYTLYFQKIGELALNFINNKEKLERLQRLYWFTIEFGLMKTSSGLKAYGAGIISSSEEMKNALSIKSIKESFNVENVLNQNFKIDRVQKKYFVINSFLQLVNSLKEVEIKI
jgi:phenylalanine-4-hydroxylase